VTIQHPTPTKTANFIISEWEDVDQYGQGVDIIWFYENSTGSWVAAPWYYVGGALDGLPYYALHNYDPYILNWSAGVSMKIRIQTLINQTLTGASTVNEGKKYLRHNISVYSLNMGVEVFSQENFTYYDGGLYDSMIWYKHEVVLEFLPQGASNYRIDIDFEIYYESGQQGAEYEHDCSDTSDITYDSNSGLGGGDYGIGSNGSIIEIWIVPDSVADEKVIYKLEFTDIDNSDGDVNLTVRYRVEDGWVGFRLDLYYTDSTWDSTGLRTSQTWENQIIVADTKTLDYALLYCDDNPASVASGNHSVYIDFIEITSESGSLTYMVDQWNIVTNMQLYFHVDLHEWGLNTGLILAGLVMIPASGMYLVYGGRKKFSTDKMAYALIAFMVGLGLLVGGIMP